jgi:hypothetical protein
MSDAFYTNDRVFGDIPILRADREPCLVCGHPTGDCTPDDHNPQDIHIDLSDSRLESLKNEKLIYVDETIYGERQITPFTTAKVILARAGTYVTVDKARELGIKVN